MCKEYMRVCMCLCMCMKKKMKKNHTCPHAKENNSVTYVYREPKKLLDSMQTKREKKKKKNKLTHKCIQNCYSQMELYFTIVQLNIRTH